MENNGFFSSEILREILRAKNDVIRTEPGITRNFTSRHINQTLVGTLRQVDKALGRHRFRANMELRKVTCQKDGWIIETFLKPDKAVKMRDKILVVQLLSHIWLCDPMDCSTPGFPVLFPKVFPKLFPKVCSNSCPLSQWCPPTISSSVVPFSSCFQSFPASGSFPVSQLFTSGGQSVGVSALVSVLLMNIQGWFTLGLISLICLQFKGLSRVFSNT